LEGVLHGDLLTFSWPGGIDIGPFSGAIDIPSELVFSTPAFTSDGCQFQFAFDIEQDLDLAWDASSPGDFVVVALSVLPLKDGAYATLRCFLEDDGEYTIPQAALSQLPPSMAGSLAFLAARCNVKRLPVSLAMTEETAYVDVVAAARVFAWAETE
jgi:hypothetical protein